MGTKKAGIVIEKDGHYARVYQNDAGQNVVTWTDNIDNATRWTTIGNAAYINRTCRLDGNVTFAHKMPVGG